MKETWHILEPWQRKRVTVTFLLMVLGFGAFLIWSCCYLWQDKTSEERYWQQHLSTDPQLQSEIDALSTGATRVTTGTYVGNIPKISIKDSTYEIYVWVWFKWQGDDSLDPVNNFRFYKGTIKDLEVVKEATEGDLHYQLARCDVVVNKSFWTARFPLESHQLFLYMESNYPVSRMLYVKDADSSVSSNISISGFDVRRSDSQVVGYRYDSTHGDPDITEDVVTSEFLTAIEINRTGLGLYLKCFIALVGTITWVMITLFICTYHHVDPLSMIPAALFGTVTNIMVGANLLPDAMDFGLLEMVNFFGIAILLTGALAIININRVRNKHKAMDFAGFYGKIMFFTLLFFVIAGTIALPLSAYMM